MTVTEYPSVADTFARVTSTTQSVVYYEATSSTQIAYTDQRLTKPKFTNGELVSGRRRKFTYDSHGRIAIVSESDALNNFSSFRLVQTFQYEYGADNLPTTLIISGTAPLLERDIYAYTFLDGNAVHVKLSITNSRSSTPTLFDYDIRFDDAPGVYTNFFAIYPGITSFNKNNVINTNAAHVNDERGLLIRRIVTGNYINDVTQYTYETY